MRYQREGPCDATGGVDLLRFRVGYVMLDFFGLFSGHRIAYQQFVIPGPRIGYQQNVSSRHRPWQSASR